MKNHVLAIVLRASGENMPASSSVVTLPKGCKVGEKLKRDPALHPGEWEIVRIFDHDEQRKLLALQELVPRFESLLGF